MLTQSSAVLGTNLSTILVEKGMRLVPKNNTLVSELSNAILGLDSQSDIFDKDYIPNILVNNSSGEEVVTKGVKSYIHSSHDTFMDNYIDDLSGLVRNYIAFSRNVVNKEVTLLKEELEECLTQYRYKEPEDFFNIKYFKLHEVFNSYIISSEVTSYLETNGNSYFESMNLNTINAEDFDIIKYLTIGDEEQDKQTINWANSLGSDAIKHLIVNNIPEYSLSVDQKLNYSLVNYLFYRNLTERSDLDLGLSSGSLISKSSNNRDYFGTLLCLTLELYHKDIRNGKILASNSDLAFSYFNDRPLDITVYEENLEKLGEAELTLDVLFGYISSGLGNIDVTVDILIRNEHEYINRWKNTRSLYLINLNNSKLDVFKQLLRERFESSLNKEDKNEEEAEFLLQNNGFLEETRTLGNKYIDELDSSDIEDIDRITLELVAKIRYRFTNAYFILKEMNTILKMNDSIEPIEAALYATISYITDYLLEQVDVVSIG